MRKTALALILITTACAVTVTTTANAWFKSIEENKTSGKATGKNIRLNFSGVVVECAAANGSWGISDTKTSQTATKEGGHLNIEAALEGKTIGKTTTGHCDAASKGGAFEAAIINPLRVQIQQPSKDPSSKVSSLLAKFKDTVNVSLFGVNCTVSIPSKSNQQLPLVNVEKSGSLNIKVIPSLQGITIEASGAQCSALGIASGAEGTLSLGEGGEVLAEGVTLV